jgi:hypothetical protein
VTDKLPTNQLLEGPLTAGPHEEALRNLAADLGVSPEELHRRIEERFESLHTTKDCLTLDEVERIAVWGQLEPDRNVHVSACPFCQEMLAALQGDPKTEQRVLTIATEAEQGHGVGYGVGLISGVIASATAVWGLRRLLAKPDHR